jgi:DNA repair exonuclease SbcCD ATPase subunit
MSLEADNSMTADEAERSIYQQFDRLTTQRDVLREELKNEREAVTRLLDRVEELKLELAECHAADNRPDVCFTRGFRQGRYAAQEALKAQRADNERLRAELGKLREQVDGSFGGVSRNQIYAMGKRDALAQLTELREAAETLAAWVESGPNASKAMQLRAVLAKVADGKA